MRESYSVWQQERQDLLFRALQEQIPLSQHLEDALPQQAPKDIECPEPELRDFGRLA
jgi:hypothetical protein